MRRFTSIALLLASAGALVSVPAFAQRYPDPYYGNRDPYYGGNRDPYYGGGRDPYYGGNRDPYYGNRGRYGSGYGDPVDRALGNLQRAASVKSL